MNCSENFLLSMDSACDKSHFPIWDCNQDYAFTGAMCVSGYIAPTGVGLIFEVVEYNIREGGIQSAAYCISTFPTKTWLHFGNGVYVPDAELRHPETGKVLLNSPSLVKVVSRDRVFEIQIEEDDLVYANPFDLEVDELVILSLLFKICDVIPSDYLFSTPDYLREIFEIPPDAEKLFILSEWEHPTNEIYEEGVKPSSYPDMIALADALCSGNASPKLTGNPNTFWREQWSITT